MAMKFQVTIYSIFDSVNPKYNEVVESAVDVDYVAPEEIAEIRVRWEHGALVRVRKDCQFQTRREVWNYLKQQFAYLEKVYN